jgi:hypothetical protein
MIGSIQIVSSIEILYGSTTGTASNAIQIIDIISDVSIGIQTAKTRNIG